MNEYQKTVDRCKELGTDKEFQAWVKEQPSMLGGGITVFAHVRRAWNSGVGMKPLFSGVSLTDEQHKLQHQKGELTCLQSRGWFVGESGRQAVDKAKRIFDEWAEMYREKWILTKEADQ